MESIPSNPRVLIVTPEVTYLPERMKNFSSYLTAKAGGLADVSAALIKSLFDQGIDVHVALPDYRAIFKDRLAPFIEKEQKAICRTMPDDRLHLAQDRSFFYLNQVYSDSGGENIKMALAFQREVINNILPRVDPDLIHCNDWMTGLIPAMAREMGIPCLFTIHNIHTVKTTLARIEDHGIVAAYFWQHLYYDKFPIEYEESRESNLVDFLASGVFSSHFVNTVSPTFLREIAEGHHPFVESPIRQEFSAKMYAECAFGILNAPDPSFNPRTDKFLSCNYDHDNHIAGKCENKRELQKLLGLFQNGDAPIFFWPSRMDPVQKGCQLLSEIFYEVISTYWEDQLEVVFVADGEYQSVFRDIVNSHSFQERVAVCHFDERLEHLAYGASDFILMPSRFEACGLPQMIAPIYGSLPIAHDTGGIHDTIKHMDVNKNEGNGFLFETYDSPGLFWAIKQAMIFYHLPPEKKVKQIQRVMKFSSDNFNYAVTAKNYIELYEKMLERPLVTEYSAYTFSQK